jgi:hypothetical protein
MTAFLIAMAYCTLCALGCGVFALLNLKLYTEFAKQRMQEDRAKPEEDGK